MWPFSTIMSFASKRRNVMKKEERIRKNSHFRYVYSRGKSYSNSSLIMYITRNNKKLNRVGFSVSKKVGKSVVRSRVKRLIRESYRNNKDMIVKGYDIVFIARSRASELGYHEIEKSVISLIKKGGLLKEGE